jgi:hypothetical protein
MLHWFPGEAAEAHSLAMQVQGGGDLLAIVLE